MVLISLPTFYVNHNEQEEHLYITNYKHIELETLNAIILKALEIEYGDKKKQLQIISELSAEVLKNKKFEKASQTFLSIICDLSKKIIQLDVEENYTNLQYECIDFNVMRKYENYLHNGLLKNHTIIEKNYEKFNSMEEIIECRKKLGDSDLNRCYFVIEKFTENVLFKPNRLVDSSLKLTNILLIFIILNLNSKDEKETSSSSSSSSSSSPLTTESTTILNDHYLAVLLDSLLRFRLLTQWQINPYTRRMLLDMSVNYDKRILLSKLCMAEHLKDKIQIVMTHLNSVKETEKLAQKINYNDYLNLLNTPDISYNVNGKKYYCFYTSFLMNILNTESFKNTINESKNLFDFDNDLLKNILQDYNEKEEEEEEEGKNSVVVAAEGKDNDVTFMEE